MSSNVSERDIDVRFIDTIQEENCHAEPQTRVPQVSLLRPGFFGNNRY
jgi:hypothetical protein